MVPFCGNPSSPELGAWYCGKKSLREAGPAVHHCGEVGPQAGSTGPGTCLAEDQDQVGR